jgi:hypothetical protein
MRDIRYVKLIKLYKIIIKVYVYFLIQRIRPRTNLISFVVMLQRLKFPRNSGYQVCIGEQTGFMGEQQALPATSQAEHTTSQAFS